MGHEERRDAQPEKELHASQAGRRKWMTLIDDDKASTI